MQLNTDATPPPSIVATDNGAPSTREDLKSYHWRQTCDFISKASHLFGIFHVSFSRGHTGVDYEDECKQRKERKGWNRMSEYKWRMNSLLILPCLEELDDAHAIYQDPGLLEMKDQAFIRGPICQVQGEQTLNAIKKKTRKKNKMSKTQEDKQLTKKQTKQKKQKKQRREEAKRKEAGKEQKSLQGVEGHTTQPQEQLKQKNAEKKRERAMRRKLSRKKKSEEKLKQKEVRLEQKQDKKLKQEDQKQDKIKATRLKFLSADSTMVLLLFLSLAVVLVALAVVPILLFCCCCSERFCYSVVIIRCCDLVVRRGTML